MAILDGTERTREEVEALLLTMNGVFRPLFESADLDPATRAVFDLMNEGLALADIFKVTRAQRRALSAHAAALIKAGRHEQARGLAFRLTLLEPLDAQPYYLFAMTYQLEGAFEMAGKLYIEFLSRDATNAEGYVRLGECLLAEGSHAPARDAFRTAVRLVEAGHGTPATRDRARHMAAHCDILLAGREAPHATPVSTGISR